MPASKALQCVQIDTTVSALYFTLLCVKISSFALLFTMALRLQYALLCCTLQTLSSPKKHYTAVCKTFNTFMLLHIPLQKTLSQHYCLSTVFQHWCFSTLSQHCVSALLFQHCCFSTLFQQLSLSLHCCA